TLWDITGAAGVSVGVVGWPLTYPASAVQGYLVSEVYHRLIATPSGIDDPSALYPLDIQSDAFHAVEAAVSDDAPLIRTVSLDPRYQMAARTDRIYERIAGELTRSRPAQMTITRYQSLDAIGHYFLRYANPTEFGD